MKNIDDPDQWNRVPCARCGNPMGQEHPYAWCDWCCKNGTCVHGNRPHECNECMIQSDRAYDEARELE